MKKLTYLLVTLGIVLLFSGCSSNNAAPQTTPDSNPAEIHLTTQVEGIFKGFEGDNQVKIEHDGKVETYEMDGDVVGDLDKVKEGDNIAFSTKEVNGKTVLETLRLN